MYIKLLRSTFSSDLRKPCFKTGKSLSLYWKILLCSWENPNYMMSNRIRSIHMNVIDVVWENIILHNITNILYVFLWIWVIYNGVILTILVLGRCYTYFCGRWYCHFFLQTWGSHVGNWWKLVFKQNIFCSYRDLDLVQPKIMLPNRKRNFHLYRLCLFSS